MSLEVVTGITSGPIQANRAATFSTFILLGGTDLLLAEMSTHTRSQVCSCCVCLEVSHALLWDGEVIPLQNRPSQA